MEDTEYPEGKDSFMQFLLSTFNTMKVKPNKNAMMAMESLYGEFRELFGDMQNNIRNDNILTQRELMRWNQIEDRYRNVDERKIDQEISKYFKEDAAYFNENELINLKNTITEEQKSLNMFIETTKLTVANRKAITKPHVPVIESHDSIKDTIENIKEEYLNEAENMTHAKMYLYNRICSFSEQVCSEEGTVCFNFITQNNSTKIRDVNEKFINQSSLYYDRQIAEFEKCFGNPAVEDIQRKYLKAILRMKMLSKEKCKLTDILEQEIETNKRINEMIQELRDGSHLTIADIRLRSVENDVSVNEMANWITLYNGDRTDMNNELYSVFIGHLLTTLMRENYEFDKLNLMSNMLKHHASLNCMYLTFTYREYKALMLALKLYKEASEFMEQTMSANRTFMDSISNLKGTEKINEKFEISSNLRRLLSIGVDKDIYTDVKRISSTIERHDEEISKVYEELNKITERSEELIKGGGWVLSHKSFSQAKSLIFDYHRLRSIMKQLTRKYNEEEDRLKKNKSLRIKKKLWISFVNGTDELERMYNELCPPKDD